MDLQSMSLPAVVSFGAVWIVSYYAEKWFDRKIETTEKLIAMGIIAFGVGYIPVELGNDLLNRVRDVLYVVSGATALYQGPKAIVKTVGGK